MVKESGRVSINEPDCGHGVTREVPLSWAQGDAQGVMQQEQGTSLDVTQKRRTVERTGRPLRVCMHVLGTGRTDVRVARSAWALLRAGHEVRIVDIEHDMERPAREQIEGAEYRHIRMSPKWQRYYQPVAFVPWIVFKALRILRGIVEVVATPADVYHAHDVTALPACYLAAMLRHKRLVYDAHELPLVDPQHTQHSVVWHVSTWLMRRMVPRCDAVISVSPLLVAELTKRFGGPEPVVIRNIPPYQQAPSSDRLRERLGVSAETRIALYQGNFQDDRGLDILVKAAHALNPQHRIVLMGRDLMQGRLTALIEREGVGDRVIVLPPVPNRELTEWTASASMGLIIYRSSYSPNVRYCLPNKLFEYLMAGVPVVASQLDAVAELLARDGVGVALESVEPERVAGALNALLDDAPRLERMRRSALLATKRELNWERESNRLVELYELVAKSHRERDRERGGKRARAGQSVLAGQAGSAEVAAPQVVG